MYVPPAMRLSEIVRENLIYPDLHSGEKAVVLRTMVQGIVKVFPELNEERLLSVILDRERLSSTGIGSGIAIPHAKFSDCKQQIAAFGRIRDGILFDSIDKKPVHLVFLIVGPVGANETHLKVLARISKFLHDTNFRDRLMTAENAQLIYEAILEKDAQY